MTDKAPLAAQTVVPGTISALERIAHGGVTDCMIAQDIAANALESLPPETSGNPATRAPDGYAWRRHTPIGDDTYLDFQNSGTVNGCPPIEAVPYWVGSAAPTEFPKRPGECRHETAMLKCNECGIDFSRVTVKSGPEFRASEETPALLLKFANQAELARAREIVSRVVIPPAAAVETPVAHSKSQQKRFDATRAEKETPTAPGTLTPDEEQRLRTAIAHISEARSGLIDWLEASEKDTSIQPEGSK